MVYGAPDPLCNGTRATKRGLVAIALVKIEPKLNGEFRIRVPDTSEDYWEIVIKAPDETTWGVFEYGDPKSLTTFKAPGEYFIDLSLNNVVIHKIPLLVEQG